MKEKGSTILLRQHDDNIALLDNSKIVTIRWANGNENKAGHIMENTMCIVKLWCHGSVHKKQWIWFLFCKSPSTLSTHFPSAHTRTIHTRRMEQYAFFPLIHDQRLLFDITIVQIKIKIKIQLLLCATAEYPHIQSLGQWIRPALHQCASSRARLKKCPLHHWVKLRKAQVYANILWPLQR